MEHKNLGNMLQYFPKFLFVLPLSISNLSTCEHTKRKTACDTTGVDEDINWAAFAWKMFLTFMILMFIYSMLDSAGKNFFY